MATRFTFSHSFIFIYSGWKLEASLVILPKHLSVSITVLLAKLYYYSIRGLNAHWTESCPVNRKQKIILQNQKKK